MDRIEFIISNEMMIIIKYYLFYLDGIEVADTNLKSCVVLLEIKNDVQATFDNDSPTVACIIIANRKRWRRFYGAIG